MVALGHESNGNIQRLPALVLELKAPHKLALGRIFGLW